MTKVTGKADEIHLREMSTTRMHHGEAFVTMWVTGPRGGGGPMLRFDKAEADKLLRQLARACAKLEEMAVAASYADGFRRRATPNRKAKAKRRPRGEAA